MGRCTKAALRRHIDREDQTARLEVVIVGDAGCGSGESTYPPCPQQIRYRSARRARRCRLTAIGSTV